MNRYMRFLSIVIAVVCLCNFACAESTDIKGGNTKTNIQFRNIPWKTTIGYFIDNVGGVNIPNAEFNWWKGDIAIPEDGYDCCVSSVYSIAYYMDCPYDVDYIANDTYDYVPGRKLDWYNYSWSSSTLLNVAGYDIEKVSLYFMQPVENNTINHDKEAAEFYMATYRITDNVDRVSVYEDFSTKLTNLYGDLFYELNEGQVVRIWKDPEGNSVTLIRYSEEWENLDDITIVYMAGKTMTNIQALNSALYDEQYLTDSSKREENSNNYEGL